MDLARDTPVRLVPYPFARLNGALLLEISEKEALLCLRQGARPQVLAELRRALGVPARVTAVGEAEASGRGLARGAAAVAGRAGAGARGGGAGALRAAPRAGMLAGDPVGLLRGRRHR